MKILVAGIGKSGTTGLYYLVKNSLEGDPVYAFEPPLENLTGDETLVKSLVSDTRPGHNLYELGIFDQFDKRLFIVRDPRDRLVSGTLYSAATTRFKSRPELDEWLELLAQKETDPRSVSLVTLRGNHPDILKKEYGRLQIECCADYDHCLVRYEDFVEGRTEEMEKYLGMKLTAPDGIHPGHRRVVRSKRAGNWRNWMTPEDVDYLRPLFTRFMEHFDYDNDDWELNEEPVIEPALSSEYVNRVWPELSAWRAS